MPYDNNDIRFRDATLKFYDLSNAIRDAEIQNRTLAKALQELIITSDDIIWDGGKLSEPYWQYYEREIAPNISDLKHKEWIWMDECLNIHKMAENVEDNGMTVDELYSGIAEGGNNE